MQYTNCHLVGSSLVGVMCDAFRNESAKQDVATPTWTSAPVLLTFSPFLTISLCRAGQYLSHTVFSVLCHVFSHSVFLHVSLYVVPPSLDFAQMWLGSRFKQWPNHFSLLFSRKVSTGFTWASFLMSSFLMWSNLVFPLAHLNILMSAEFSFSHLSSLRPNILNRTSSLV